MKIENKFTLREDSQYGAILYKDGRPQMCYVPNPMIVPNNLGGTGIMRVPCNNDCPHFFVIGETEKEAGAVLISCGAMGIKRILSEEVNQATLSKSKV